MRSFAFALGVLFPLAACGASGDSAPGGGSGGGGVSFGGAQDIGEFRQILTNGQIPGPDTLDANGFFNEHFNAQPAASCGGTLCISPGLSVGRDWLTNQQQATLQLAVTTPVDPSTYQRLPLDLVVVVDHSGSMASDQRLDKVKTGLHTMVEHLQPDDRVALLSFDDVVTIDQPFTSDRIALDRAITALEPRGGTNIYDGLEAGFQQLGDVPDRERQNRVIFLSDGLATVGNTSQAAIMEMSTGWIERGIGLTTIGVGDDFDVDLMRGLAERGAGNFYFLENPTAASEVFTEELDYFVSPLALDVQITAASGAGWTMGEQVGSRLWQTDSSNAGSMAIPAVFLASRTSQGPDTGRRGGGSMIFIHLTPTGETSSKIATITLSYRQPDQAERVTQTVTLDYAGDPSDAPADPYLSTPEMGERYAMYNVFLGLRAATKSMDLECAAAALVATQRSASAWNGTHEDPDIAADLGLIDQYLTNLRAQGATGGTELATCAAATDPYGDGYGYYGDDTMAMGCSATGAGAHGGWLAILAALLGVLYPRHVRSGRVRREA